MAIFHVLSWNFFIFSSGLFLTVEGKSQTCVEHVGCFSVGGDFRQQLYPVLPLERKYMNIYYRLYTRNNSEHYHKLNLSDPQSVKTSPLNVNKITRIIIHGFHDGEPFTDWMEVMKDAFLKHGDDNVIIVNWNSGSVSHVKDYVQSAADARIVGAEISLLLDILEDEVGFSVEKCHLVGYSLGAHVAGYVGERTRDLRRITGLDPVSLLFNNMPPSIRLDPTDAVFVDVIHTDVASNIHKVDHAHEAGSALGLGISHNVGHVDFYPNNGVQQPGCVHDRFTTLFTQGLKKGLEVGLACHHRRSVDYFIKSMNSSTPLPLAYQCSSWEDFTKGLCSDCGTNGSKCAIMGIRAEEYMLHKDSNNNITMFLHTGAKEDSFWLNHYRVQIPKATGSATLKLWIKGSQDSESFSLGEKQSQVIKMYQNYLVTTAKDLGKLQAVVLKIENFHFVAPEIPPPRLNLIPMSYEKEEDRAVNEFYKCNKTDKSSTADKSMYLYKPNNCESTSTSNGENPKISTTT